MRWLDRVVRVMVEMAVVAIERSANTHINCVRKGRSRSRLVIVTVGRPRCAKVQRGQATGFSLRLSVYGWLRRRILLPVAGLPALMRTPYEAIDKTSVR